MCCARKSLQQIKAIRRKVRRWRCRPKYCPLEALRCRVQGSATVFDFIGSDDSHALSLLRGQRLKRADGAIRSGGCGCNYKSIRVDHSTFLFFNRSVLGGTVAYLGSPSASPVFC